jgi:hypothetical protein
MNIGFKDIALGEIALKYHFDEGENKDRPKAIFY